MLHRIFVVEGHASMRDVSRALGRIPPPDRYGRSARFSKKRIQSRCRVNSIAPSIGGRIEPDRACLDISN